MTWNLYDYVNDQGWNDFEIWSRGLQKRELAALNRKLKALEDNGPNLSSSLLAGPIKGYAHIYKIRINGDVALRPLLCKGPIDNDHEFTLLKGAIEKDRKWVPATAPSEAATRRESVKNEPKKRRRAHVKVL